jgi:hypothetical protein
VRSSCGTGRLRRISARRRRPTAGRRPRDHTPRRTLRRRSGRTGRGSIGVRARLFAGRPLLDGRPRVRSSRRLVAGGARFRGGGRFVDGMARRSGGCSVDGGATVRGGGRLVDGARLRSGGCSVDRGARLRTGGRSVDGARLRSGGCSVGPGARLRSGGCSVDRARLRCGGRLVAGAGWGSGPRLFGGGAIGRRFGVVRPLGGGRLTWYGFATGGRAGGCGAVACERSAVGVRRPLERRSGFRRRLAALAALPRARRTRRGSLFLRHARERWTRGRGCTLDARAGRVRRRSAVWLLVGPWTVFTRLGI